MVSKLFRNKRGGMLFLYVAIILIIGVFVFAIVNTFSIKVLGDLNTDIQADDQMSADAKLVVENLNDQMSTTLDNSVLMMMSLLFIVGFGAAWFSDSHPLFLIVAILVMVVLLIGGLWLSNAWDEVSSESDLAVSVAKQPFTNWLLDHFLMVNMVMIFLMIIFIGVKNT